MLSDVELLIANRVKLYRLRTSSTPSHDLAVIRQMRDRLAVMTVGEIVELANAETLFSSPRHDYTREILRLAPSLDRIFAKGRGTTSV